MRPGSPAEAAGIEPGDLIVSLDGHQLHDVIDYQFYLEPRWQLMGIERNDSLIEAELDGSSDGDPGISFASAIFDRIRTCPNRCLFCFVDQVPEGLRRPLYLKDDDFRLSFLHGNFITLNNMDEADVERIIEQRLSPLYVSVHSTDPEVRGRVMGCGAATAARGLEVLRRLGEAGIETHVQIVLCPEINDGAVLERTVTELAAKYKGVASIGVVPVSLSEDYLRRHAGSGMRPLDAADCAAAIDTIASLRDTGFIYAADELFIRSGRPLPPPEYYDDFAQYENGIGIAATLLLEGEELVREALADSSPGDGELDSAPVGSGRIYLLTGTLAAGLIESFSARLGDRLQRDIRPLVAGNRLFGSHVTVTGLLGGRDVIRAAREAGLGPGDQLLIPADSLDSARERFLDDLTLEELDEALECRITVV